MYRIFGAAIIFLYFISISPFANIKDKSNTSNNLISQYKYNGKFIIDNLPISYVDHDDLIYNGRCGTCLKHNGSGTVLSTHNFWSRVGRYLFEWD